MWDDDIQNYYIRCTLRDGKKPNGKTKYRMFYLHRYIMDAEEGNYVDHMNHNSLDNTKNNLKVTTDQENVSNRKGANKNSGTGVRNVNYGTDKAEYWVQFMRKGERYRWVFPLNKFNEACKFAEIKRKEIYGDLSIKR